MTIQRLKDALGRLCPHIKVCELGDGSIRVELDVDHVRLERLFDTQQAFERHGLEVVSGLMRDALTRLTSPRPTHTTDLGMVLLEEDLGALGGTLEDVDVVSTRSFRIEELPLITALEPVEEAPSFQPTLGATGHKTTLIDQAELHRRLNNTPVDALSVQDVERAHATLVPGNYATASLQELQGQQLIDAIERGLSSYGYQEALVVEIAQGQISIQLGAGLQAYIKPTSELRDNLMGTLADIITRARALGALPTRGGTP